MMPLQTSHILRKQAVSSALVHPDQTPNHRVQALTPVPVCLDQTPNPREQTVSPGPLRLGQTPNPQLDCPVETTRACNSMLNFVENYYMNLPRADPSVSAKVPTPIEYHSRVL